MANFITTAITWAGKETLDFFWKPIFIGKSPLETQGLRVITGVNSVQKLNFIDGINKITKAYTKGFTGTNSGTYTQRSLQVYQLKAEKAQDANEFYNTVVEQILGKGYTWNDIKSAPILNEIVMGSFVNALKSDLFRIAWLADTRKETVSSGFWSGTADTDYNMFDGFLRMFYDNSATSPSASQFQKVAMSHGSVAQKDTHTFTGTSGTANLAVNGKNYLATFDSGLTKTAANFVTDHAASLLLRDVIATSSGAKVTLLSRIAGRPFTSTAAANVSGNLASIKAATTANTAPAALLTDETIGYMASLYKGANVNLRNLDPSRKVFLMDSASYYNLEDTLDTDGTETGHMLLADGTTVLKYKGMPCLKMDWDAYAGDFPVGIPNVIIYTSIDNLVLGLDTTDEMNMIEEWYNSDEQENRFRCQYKMGVNYVHPEYSAIAF